MYNRSTQQAFSIIIISFAFAFFAQAIAQNPAATPTPSRAFKVLELEREMAESGYKINPSVQNRVRLITVYDQYVEYYCMPDIHKTLEHKGQLEDQNCLFYLNRTLELDPNDAIAICARDGIDGVSCKSAFDAQILRTFKSSSYMKDWEISDNLKAKLELSKNKEIIDKLSAEFSKLIERYAPRRDPSNLAQIQELAEKLVTESCRFSHQSLEPKVTRSNTPIANAPPPSFLRVRYLPEECLNYINKALNWDKLSVKAVCYRDGFLHPNCINVRRAKRKALKAEEKQKNPENNSSAAKSFETF